MGQDSIKRGFDHIGTLIAGTVMALLFGLVVVVPFIWVLIQLADSGPVGQVLAIFVFVSVCMWVDGSRPRGKNPECRKLREEQEREAQRKERLRIIQADQNLSMGWHRWFAYGSERTRLKRDG